MRIHDRQRLMTDQEIKLISMEILDIVAKLAVIFDRVDGLQSS